MDTVGAMLRIQFNVYILLLRLLSAEYTVLESSSGLCV